MKTAKMLLITAVAVVINFSTAIAAEVIVTPKNIIVLDSDYQKQEDQSLIMSVELRKFELSGKSWYTQGFKIQNAKTNQQLIGGDDLINIYSLRSFSILVNGKEINFIDSITPENNLITAGFVFAAGSRLEIKAKFPDGAKGILKLNIKLYFQEFEQPRYEQFEFIQTVYAGVEAETTSSTSPNLELNKIIVCQNTIDRVITLKNIPMGNTLKVYNLQGLLIYENKEAKLEESINFKNVPVGIFIITIGGDSAYKKVII